MIKEYIVKALKWALSKFEDKPAGEAWPFPVGHEPKIVVKKKPTVAKKATVVAKKTTKKAK
jgi:hypothetical protein